MIKTYKGAKGPKGDLAHDMSYDSDTFPRNEDGDFKQGYKIISEYLMRQGACYDCMVTFDDAWDDYVRSERVRLWTS